MNGNGIIITLEYDSCKTSGSDRLVISNMIVVNGQLALKNRKQILLLTVIVVLVVYV